MKSSLAIVVACILLSGLTAPAVADEVFDQCKAAPNADGQKCGDAWLAREQAAVDSKWNALLELTDGGVADTLANEHTAWSEFKDASCVFMRDTAFAPGGDTSTYYACRAGVIAERSRALDAYTSYIDN